MPDSPASETGRRDSVEPLAHAVAFGEVARHNKNHSVAKAENIAVKAKRQPKAKSQDRAAARIEPISARSWTNLHREGKFPAIRSYPRGP
jgi:hypothetical protein